MPRLDHDRRELVAVDTLSGRELIPVLVRRACRARQIRLSVQHGGEVILSLPPGVPAEKGLRFAESQGHWLVRTIGRNVGKKRPCLLRHLQSGNRLSGLGREWTVEIEAARRGTWRADRGAGHLVLRTPFDEQIEVHLAGVLRAFAQTVIPLRVLALAGQRNLRYESITIRNQRGRWGSCSVRGGLSFNWRLVLLPPVLHDYIIWHELAHLTELNHSERYWDLLRTYDDLSDEHDREITRRGREWIRMGREV